MPSHSAKIIPLFPEANTASQPSSVGDPKIGPVTMAEPQVPQVQATIDDLLDPTAVATGFSTMARARFASLHAALTAARGADPVDKDDAIMQLQSELPRAFILNGWSEGALTLMSALNHAIANRRGIPLDPTQYLRVLDAVRTLKEMPALRYERALDLIQILDDTGLVTEPEEAELLQTISDAD